MSKGPGKVQSYILDALEANKSKDWMYLSNIAFDYGREHGLLIDEGYGDELPYPMFESFKRAARVLAKAGAIGYAGLETYERVPICWIPENKPKGVSNKRPLPAMVAEEVVYYTAKSFFEMSEEEQSYERRIYNIGKTLPVMQVDNPKAIPYKWLRAMAIKLLDARTGSHHIPSAVTKAVKSLAKQGRIKAYWYRVGRYGWIELV